MKNEPLVTVASITAGVTALLGLAVAFGVPVTQEQQVAILGVVAVAAPFVVAAAARRLVTPNGNVVEYADTSGTVRAGEANEIKTDQPIRMLDEAPEVEPDDQLPDLEVLDAAEGDPGRL